MKTDHFASSGIFLTVIYMRKRGGEEKERRTDRHLENETEGSERL